MKTLHKKIPFLTKDKRVIDVTVKIEKVMYMGYCQGHKVYLNGKKFPREHGHWYTALDEIDVLNYAISDALMVM